MVPTYRTDNAELRLVDAIIYACLVAVIVPVVWYFDLRERCRRQR